MDMTGLIDVLGENGTNLAIGLIGWACVWCLRATEPVLPSGGRHRICPWQHGTETVDLAAGLWRGGHGHPASCLQTAWLIWRRPGSSLHRKACLGAAIGGLMFGAGMVLARGCASRLLVLVGDRQPEGTPVRPRLRRCCTGEPARFPAAGPRMDCSLSSPPGRSAAMT